MTSRPTERPTSSFNRSTWRRLPAIAAAAVVVYLSATAAPSGAQTGPILNQNIKLLASDGQSGDLFGFSLAFSGNTAVVGAFGDDDNGMNSGSAYVYVRDANGVWTQQAKLFASDGAAGDFFGGSVAISGDTAVFGAETDGDNGINSGSAYIFVRNPKGVWTQQVKLLASDGTAGDFFSESLAINGDTAVIGARGDDDNGSGSGSAYVFVRDANGVWTQQAKLLASDGAVGDFFGNSVSIDRNTAFVGAFLDDDACPGDSNCNSGSVYVFTRNVGGLWAQQAKLLASDAQISDIFGVSVAISGDTAIIGSPNNPAFGVRKGSAYIFTRDASGLWNQQAKLLASDGQASDEVGGSVAISGGTVVMGARLDDYDNISNTGSAYIFARDAAGLWTQHVKLVANDGQPANEFGSSVAISGDTALAGAPREGNIGFGSGSAYVFELSSPVFSADLNGNGVVDGADLGTLLMQWGTNGDADLNGDGVVNSLDLATLLTNWG